MPKKSSNGPPSSPASPVPVKTMVEMLAPAGYSEDDEARIKEAVDTVVGLEKKGWAVPSYRDVVYLLRQEYGISLSTNAFQKRVERARDKQ